MIKQARALLLMLVCTTAVYAQHEQHHHEAAEKIGKVKFTISCSSEAQKQFNRAVAWLHSFEYDEAARAFSEVAKLDSTCGMAQWGVAMSLYHQLWAPPTRAELERGAAAVAAARLAGAKTDRERAYIGAIEAFFKDWDKLDHQKRAIEYERAMEQIHTKYPDDPEAGIFYALALNATALATVPADKTYARQKTAAVILNRVLREQPDHPGVTHYIIHSYDYPQLAYLALDAARRYAKIAPASAHARHMPSHIFTREGLWQEGVASNIASAAAAKDYAVKNRLGGAWDEQLHAMDYLAYAYLQVANDREAKRVLDELRSIRKTDPESFKCAYSFAAIPSRYALERRRWSDAAQLKVEPAEFPWQRFRWAEALVHFARAVGAARSGDQGAARAALEKLTEIKTGFEGKKENYDWATQIEIQRQAAAGWVARVEGKNEDALRLLRSAADLEDATDKHPVTPGALLPAREMLGDLLLELDRPREALVEFERSLKDSPNRFNGLYGAARAAELAGDREKAKQLYTKLAGICEGADSDRPEVQRLRSYSGMKASSR